MNRYRVARGPVSPPASEYRHVQHLDTGDIVLSRETPWIRQCLRDGRLERAEDAAELDQVAPPNPEPSPRPGRGKRGIAP